jgi:hypothetical protein
MHERKFDISADMFGRHSTVVISKDRWNNSNNAHLKVLMENNESVCDELFFSKSVFFPLRLKRLVHFVCTIGNDEQGLQTAKGRSVA